MKKQVLGITIAIFVVLAFVVQTVNAQEKKSKNYFTIVQWKSVIPDDGTYAERDSLLNVMYEAQKSNEKVISRKSMTHVYGDDAFDLVVITEYASWNDIMEAAKIDSKLMKDRFPDKEERAAFWKALSKYFDGHSDEIFMSLR